MTDERTMEFETRQEEPVNTQTDLVPTETSATTEDSDPGTKVLKALGVVCAAALAHLGYKKFIAPKVKSHKIEKAKKLLKDEGYMTYKPEPMDFSEDSMEAEPEMETEPAED